MNKKAGYAFRIVLGGYLAWLGIRMLIELSNERPSNMVSMGIISVVFTIIGAGYAIYCVKKVLDLKKEELGLMDPDTEPEVEEAVNEVKEDSAKAQERREALPTMSDTVINVENDDVDDVEADKEEQREEPAATSEVSDEKKESEETEDESALAIEVVDKKDVSEVIDFAEESDAQLEEDIENDYEEK